VLLTAGRVAAAGPVGGVITTAHVSAAFDYPVEVRRDDDGRWAARARARVA
jgi:iron complex transport system ATP-binding protein